jgi:hypothetical protein
MTVRPDRPTAGGRFLSAFLADLLLFLLPLLLQPRDFRGKLAAQFILGQRIAFGLLDFPLQKNLLLRDFGGDFRIDFGNALLLLFSERAGGRLFFKPAHGEFVSGFHADIINGRRRILTEKLPHPPPRVAL